jgi:hypothetical protein
VLTTAEDRVLRILQTCVIVQRVELTGREYPDADSGDDKDNGQKAKFTTPREFPQPDAIVSTAWYPAASVLAPETYCLVVGVRDTPVRLLDASDGRVSTAPVRSS